HPDVVGERVVRKREVVRVPGGLRLERIDQVWRVRLVDVPELRVLSDDHENVPSAGTPSPGGRLAAVEGNATQEIARARAMEPSSTRRMETPPQPGLCPNPKTLGLRRTDCQQSTIHAKGPRPP